MYDAILKQVRSYLPEADLDPIVRAAEFASTAHEGQKRKSGEPYFVHPLGVATTIAQLRLDVPSICAAFLHDCIEDTEVSRDEIRAKFGEDVLFLVEGVTKLENIPLNSREERQAENFRKMVLAMARDIRVILIKLADRLDNMRTLGHMSPEKQERIARETKEIYAPVASRLGIQWVKTELEDLCFKYLHPEDYGKLAGDIELVEKHRKRYVTDVIRILQEEMQDAGIEAQISGRSKHLWGIYQKLRRQGRTLDLDHLYDVMAFRIITTSVDKCYQVLGRLHAKYKPIPIQFKDYIALPKDNGYQSLHTSIFGPQSTRIEIQIRTLAMHRTAEQGIAAHWLYKEGKPLRVRDESRYAWLHQLMDDHRSNADPTEFIDTVKLDLFDDEVYIFTPHGDLKSLPRGATPVDFAFGVHSEVGNHCSGARVNGVMVPLKYKLQSGDTVEIITSKNQSPNKDWLKFVATGRAKTKIRHHIRKEERARSQSLGREMLDKELRRCRLSLSKVEKSGKLAEAAQSLRSGSVDELLLAVGYGKLLSANVVALMVPEGERMTDEQPEEKGVVSKLLERVGVKRQTNRGITVQGVEDMLVRYARCCNPVHGDPILGFITRGRGVTVHTRDCPKAKDLDPARRVEVDWDSKTKTMSPVLVRVESLNRKGLLAEVSKAFTAKGVNILQATCRTFEDDYAVNTFQFQIEDLSKLTALIKGLSKIEGVLSVERVSTL
ncbi:MAG: bifunctional (p)ppGpp synthetase/guanosine-3',5'-bis(diphosphate) 3'-pyrophosphohydrolase [Polyangia bacterium]|nr:bifunctional (p)ppGpp synthetase/guanosine-3',5'-bis(diphosphate) 3'-pyrophosphohydrolase [Polyangia bacterium]